MEPLYYVIAIMGCSDAGTQCQQARIEPVRYRSAVACQVAMAQALPRNSDLMYPVVQASCQREGMTIADRDGAATTG